MKLACEKVHTWCTCSKKTDRAQATCLGKVSTAALLVYHTHTHSQRHFPPTALLYSLYWPWDPLSSSESTPVSILVPKQVDCNMCRISKRLLFFSSVRMAVIDWWNRLHTLVVFLLALCLLLLSWSIASIACRACHWSGTFFSLWHTRKILHKKCENSLVRQWDEAHQIIPC